MRNTGDESARRCLSSAIELKKRAELYVREAEMTNPEGTQVCSLSCSCEDAGEAQRAKKSDGTDGE